MTMNVVILCKAVCITISLQGSCEQVWKACQVCTPLWRACSGGWPVDESWGWGHGLAAHMDSTWWHCSHGERSGCPWTCSWASRSCKTVVRIVLHRVGSLCASKGDSSFCDYVTWGMYDAPCLESQGCYLIPLSYLLSRFSAMSSCSFCLVRFCVVMVHLKKNCPEDFWFSVRLFCTAFVEQLDDGWFVQVAAIWHYYLSWGINIILLIFFIASVDSFYTILVFMVSVERMVDDTNMS